MPHSSLESSFEEWKPGADRLPDHDAELLNLPLRNGNDRVWGKPVQASELLNLPLRNGNEILNRRHKT